MNPDPETHLPEPIDWSVIDGLRELQIEGEADFVQEMIDLFLAQTPGQLAQVAQAVAQGQPQALRHAAHTLKSQCNALGALPLGTRCLELETLGREGSMEGAADKLAGLECEFERVRRALQSPLR